MKPRLVSVTRNMIEVKLREYATIPPYFLHVARFYPRQKVNFLLFISAVPLCFLEPSGGRENA